MDTIKELLASMRFQLAERLGNPLTGAFLIAWLATNFRLLLVLLGEGAWRDKLDYIDQILYPNTYEWLRLGLLWPLVAALLYVFAYPFVARHVIEFHRNRQKELREIAIKVEGETPITKEEKSRLLLKLRQSELTWRKQMEDLQAENQALSEALTAAQKPSGFDISSLAQPPQQPPDVSETLRRTIPTELKVDQTMLLMASPTEAALLERRGISLKMARVLDLLSEGPTTFGIKQVATALGVLGGDAEILMKQMSALALLKEFGDGMSVTDLGREVLQHVVDSDQYQRVERR